jgi:hypothetical protein
MPTREGLFNLILYSLLLSFTFAEFEESSKSEFKNIQTIFEGLLEKLEVYFFINLAVSR